MTGTEQTFATFWAGERLSAFEASCLRSFAVRGYSVNVYSFDAIENVPEGVVLLDARAIASPESLYRFMYGGRPNLTHFSDYFRYCMFQKTEHIWIDADMLLLRPIDVPMGKTILGRERADSINGAIMRLDNTKPHLDRLVAETEALMGRDLKWGETGPGLITRIFDHAELFRDVFEPGAFYPITHDDFWKVFLPEYRAECQTLCEGAFGVHLWNNIVDRMGVWKMLAPPPGSFLADRFEQDGSLRFFRDTYPEKVMRAMVENWRLRQDGSALGIGNLSRQLVPSIVRTVRHHFGVSALRFLPGAIAESR